MRGPVQIVSSIRKSIQHKLLCCFKNVRLQVECGLVQALDKHCFSIVAESDLFDEQCNADLMLNEFTAVVMCALPVLCV